MNIRTRFLICLPLFVSALLATSLSAAQLDNLDDSELDARLNYLENRLGDLHQPSKYWQYGWTGFYAVSATAQYYQAIDEDDSDDSFKQWVGAIKSTGALAMAVFKPLPVVWGLEDLQQMPMESRTQKIARLRDAESLMLQSVWRADERYTLKPHLITVGVNLLGAAAIAGWGDSDDAFGSAALGIAIGEAAIWSQPTAAEQYWNSYQQKFNGTPDSAFNWRIIPGINNVSLEVQF